MRKQAAALSLITILMLGLFCGMSAHLSGKLNDFEINGKVLAGERAGAQGIELVIERAPGGSETSEPPATAGAVDNTPAGESQTPSTEVPSTPAATPVPTPSPTPPSTPSPTPPDSASGTLRSNTGTGLNIVADWSLSGTTLTVKVSAESYSLYSQGAWHAGSVTVGGQTYYFDTQAIEYDGPSLGTHELGSVTISGVSAPAQIEVGWHFQGTYGGTELDTITASGTIS